MLLFLRFSFILYPQVVVKSQNYLELSNARIQGGIFLASIGIIA